MRTRTTTMALVATVLLLGTLAGPAAARKYGVEQAGRGTWTHIEAGVAFVGTTTGSPFDGTTTGEVAADDGSLPPWPGCEAGSGTMTTVAEDGRRLTLRFWGDLCRAVSPSGYLVFRGWYEVTEYTGGKGRRVADGVGGLGMEFLADGYAQWMPMGDLY